MGTHPIFESDFDCLTEMAESEKKSPAISLKTGADVDVQFSSDEELGTIEEESTPEATSETQVEQSNEIVYTPAPLVPAPSAAPIVELKTPQNIPQEPPAQMDF